MAGYNNFSMSNNAVEAYNNGLLPKTQFIKFIKSLKILQKKHVKPFIEQYVKPREYHHTSKFYNRTEFYSLNDFWEALVGCSIFEGSGEKGDFIDYMASEIEMVTLEVSPFKWEKLI